MATDDARLLTLDDAARMLHVSRRTVDRLVKDGQLHTRRLSARVVRIEVAEVERFIREDRHGGA